MLGTFPFSFFLHTFSASLENLKREVSKTICHSEARSDEESPWKYRNGGRRGFYRHSGICLEILHFASLTRSYVQNDNSSTSFVGQRFFHALLESLKREVGKTICHSEARSDEESPWKYRNGGMGGFYRHSGNRQEIDFYRASHWRVVLFIITQLTVYSMDCTNAVGFPE